MPRLRQHATEFDFGELPPELRDGESEVWRSVAATQRWLRAQGLTLDGSIHWGPFTRWKGSAVAWARRAGLVMPAESGNHVRVDLQRMREMGLPGYGCAAEARERFKYAGVTVEQ